MGFVSGIVLGFVFGIGLIVGFARCQQVRAKRRSELAEATAAFARMTVQGTKKILIDGEYPSWVLGWLNQQLEKLWPYIDEAASELIRSSVEPIIEQYRPPILASIEFSKLTLGTVAPQFTGICLVDSEPGEIIIEVEIQWDGDPNIVLEIKPLVGVALPIQVKNIGFTGIFRLIFKPLVDEFPCFGAIAYSLRKKKQFDFTLKVIGGEISSIPGLSDAIDETIRDAIEDSITWPVRKIVAILPGDYSDLELKPAGMLRVKLVLAQELVNKDLIGKSDPFALLYVRPLRSRTKRSKTINNQLNPVWNENFEFVVEDQSTQCLTIKIFDDEGLQPSELIGCAQVELKDLEPGQVKLLWLKLVKDLEVQRDTKHTGQVHVELLYCPFGTGSQFAKPYDPDLSLTSLERVMKYEADDSGAAEIEKKNEQMRREVILRGVLSVTVVSAEGLPALDILGKSDPYVVIMMKKSGAKVKTRVLNDTLSPVWNQTFDFVVEDALHELLILEVYDHDTIGKNYIGQCIMTLTRLLVEGEFYDDFPLAGTKSGKISLHLKWAVQPIIRDS
ncbi:Synaptotagmin-5-like protein [Drosera capensis]